MRVADAVAGIVEALGDAVEHQRADVDDGFVAARFGDRCLSVDLYFDDTLIANVSVHDGDVLTRFGSWKVYGVRGLVQLVSEQLADVDEDSVAH